ncbi:hypothetical protein ACFL21_00765 [Patescibacteria group bacterium]
MDETNQNIPELPGDSNQGKKIYKLKYIFAGIGVIIPFFILFLDKCEKCPELLMLLIFPSFILDSMAFSIVTFFGLPEMSILSIIVQALINLFVFFIFGLSIEKIRKSESKWWILGILLVPMLLVFLFISILLSAIAFGGP